MSVSQPTILVELCAQYVQYVVQNSEIGLGIVRVLCEKQDSTLEYNRAELTAEKVQIRQTLVNQGLGKL